MHTLPQTAQRFPPIFRQNLCFQRSDFLAARPPSGTTTADRERNCLGAGVGVPIVKGHTVPVLITAALPADQGVCLFPLCRCHAVKGTILLALYGWQSFIWVLSCVPSIFPLPFSPTASCSIPAAWFSFGTQMRYFSGRGIPF